MSRTSRAELVRATWGAALLLAPGRILRRVHGAPVEGPGVAVLRVLGARHLLQARVVTLRPTSRVLHLATYVDLSHCLSAVPLVLVGGRYARAGVVEAVVAGAWTITERWRWRRVRSQTTP